MDEEQSKYRIFMNEIKKGTMISVIAFIIVLCFAAIAFLVSGAEWSAKDGQLNITTSFGEGNVPINIRNYDNQVGVASYCYYSGSNTPCIYSETNADRPAVQGINYYNSTFGVGSFYDQSILSNKNYAQLARGTNTDRITGLFYRDLDSSDTNAPVVKAMNVNINDDQYTGEFWSANNKSIYANGTIYGFTFSGTAFVTRSKMYKGDALAIIDDFKSAGNCKGDICDINHADMPKESKAKYTEPIVGERKNELNQTLPAIIGYSAEKEGGDLEAMTMISIKALQQLKQQVIDLEKRVEALEK